MKYMVTNQLLEGMRIVKGVENVVREAVWRTPTNPGVGPTIVRVELVYPEEVIVMKWALGGDPIVQVVTHNG